jgi:RNA polymerase sigma-70 factor (ECF subfamily)
MRHAGTDNTDAFKTLYEANYQRVRQLLTRIVGPHVSEDLTQTVFAKAAKALPGFRGDAQSSTWLYRIATHVASDWLYSRSAQEARMTVQLPEEQQGDAGVTTANTALVDDQMSPEQELVRKEMADCIRREIGQLAHGYQTVLILGELGGLSDDEVAKTLGISSANVRVRLHRARAQLREIVEKRCDFYRQELDCEPSSATCCASSKGSARSSGTERDA